MNIKTIILNYELEFRNYLIDNMQYINKLIIFEDTLDSIIFFCGFMENNIIIATKEPELNNFNSYIRLYKILINEYHFYDISNEQAKILRLVRYN